MEESRGRESLYWGPYTVQRAATGFAVVRMDGKGKPLAYRPVLQTAQDLAALANRIYQAGYERGLGDAILAAKRSKPS